MHRAGGSQLVGNKRIGFGQEGLAESGPIDWLVAEAVEALLGGRADANRWWIETGPMPLKIQVKYTTIVAVGGADRTVRLGDWTVPATDGGILAKSLVQAGDVIELGSAKRGTFSYVAFLSDLQMKPVLGSFNASSTGAFPGLLGRRLRDGDEIPVRELPEVLLYQQKMRKFANMMGKSVRINLDLAEPLYFLPGPEYDEISRDLGMESARDWYFRITSHWDRHGMRMEWLSPEGAKVSMDVAELPHSSPTVSGLIQWPRKGQPILLGPDRPTVGGYPRFGVLMSHEQSGMALRDIGSTLWLRKVSREEAHVIYLSKMTVRENWLKLMKRFNS